MKLVLSLNQIQVVQVGDYSVKQDGTEKYQYQYQSGGTRRVEVKQVYFHQIYFQIQVVPRREPISNFNLTKIDLILEFIFTSKSQSSTY